MRFGALGFWAFWSARKLALNAHAIPRILPYRFRANKVDPRQVDGRA